MSAAMISIYGRKAMGKGGMRMSVKLEGTEGHEYTHGHRMEANSEWDDSFIRVESFRERNFR